MSEIKQILLDLGYTNIMDMPKEYRVRPIYRDSGNNTVLAIKKDSGRFIDFSRGLSGTLEDLVKLSLKITSEEDAKKWLSDRNFSFNKKVAQEKPLLKSEKIYDKEMLLRLKKDHSYWIGRGVSEDILKQLQGGVALAGRMNGRYVFPIFNSKDQIVGFSGRLVEKTSEAAFKWKHLGQKSSWVYNAKLCLKDIKDNKEVFLVESIGDMLSLYSAGIKNVLVTFGLEVSTAIINFLLKLDINKIYISFNNDEAKNLAGNEAAEKAKNKLLKYFDYNQVKVALPSAKDFGEMGREEILEFCKDLNGKNTISLANQDA